MMYKKEDDSDPDLYEHDLLLDMDEDDEEERAVILSNKAVTFRRNTNSASPATQTISYETKKPVPQGAGLLDGSDVESDLEPEKFF